MAKTMRQMAEDILKSDNDRIDAALKGSPDQPRDDHGRWGEGSGDSGGGGGDKAALKATVIHAHSEAEIKHGEAAAANNRAMNQTLNSRHATAPVAAAARKASAEALKASKAALAASKKAGYTPPSVKHAMESAKAADKFAQQTPGQWGGAAREHEAAANQHATARHASSVGL